MSSSLFFNGWILDLYALERGGVALWVITLQGERRRLALCLPTTFYAAGPEPSLAKLMKELPEHEAT